MTEDAANHRCVCRAASSAPVLDHLRLRIDSHDLTQKGCRALPPPPSVPARLPQFEALAAVDPEARARDAKAFLRSIVCSGIAGRTSTRPLWERVLEGGAGDLDAALDKALRRIVHDFESLALGGDRHAGLLLPMGRSRRTATLATDLADVGKQFDDAVEAAGAHLMQQLRALLCQLAVPEIAPLKDLPELSESSKQVVYSIHELGGLVRNAPVRGRECFARAQAEC